jgi:hypothetical protein
LDASKITSGVFDVARIPGLDASKIISGTFDVARIPNIPRSKIPDFWSSPFWANIPDKPSTYPPSAHKSTHEKGGADEVKGLGSITLDDATLASLTADPTLAKGKMWYRSDLSRIRYSPDGTSVISIDPPLTAADVWSYSTRTLTQSKFPFWSAIITQNQGSVSIPTVSTVYVDIQPPSGETWGVTLSATADVYMVTQLQYFDYNGTTRRLHHGNVWGTTGYLGPIGIVITRVLTNTLYGSLAWHNSDSSSAHTGYYGYSGFKLSQPLWSPKRLNNPGPKPWKKAKSKPLPIGLEALDKYAHDILGIDPSKPDEYDVGVILEEDTPLAIDPATNFPLERYTAVVKADVLADFISKFRTGKADPVACGYSKYLKRWKTEGVDFGIPGV